MLSYQIVQCLTNQISSLDIQFGPNVNNIPYNGLFSKEFYFRIIQRGGLLRKFNSSNNLKPTINSNRIHEISVVQRLASVAIMVLHRYFKISSKLPRSQWSFIEYSATRENCQAGQRQWRNVKSPAMKIFCFLSAKQCFVQRGSPDLLVDIMLLHYSQSPSWIGAR